jgi:hypothetical protein
VRTKQIATADLRYARLERALKAAEAAGDDVKVNLIAQQMAELEGSVEAEVFDGCFSGDSL